MAHQSRWVFQLRGLDTGSAKDVSGVLRVSNGGAGGDEDETKAAHTLPSGAFGSLPDAEWLYQLKGDGSVKAWGRGE
jgi:elongator complex protein 6